MKRIVNEDVEQIVNSCIFEEASYSFYITYCVFPSELSLLNQCLGLMDNFQKMQLSKNGPKKKSNLFYFKCFNIILHSKLHGSCIQNYNSNVANLLPRPNKHIGASQHYATQITGYIYRKKLILKAA